MKGNLLTMWTLALVATGGAFVTYLAVRFENVRLGYAVDKAAREQEGLSETLRMLSLEEQTLGECDRVETIAHHTLQMRAPGPTQIVALEGRGGITGRAR